MLCANVALVGVQTLPRWTSRAWAYLLYVDEMNRLREMESLCSQAIEASIRLRNSAQELKNTARLGEHKEYAEVCENIAYVFGNRLASARTIHMDLCVHRGRARLCAVTSIKCKQK